MFAEHSGYFNEPHVQLFSKLTAGGKTTFYDSQCGIPLFIAPVGRSLEQWKSESMHHGWPSFRPDEMVKANIIIHEGGEMASTCGTHLGHNLPDNNGDRYCIDLVCIAGSPWDKNLSSTVSNHLQEEAFGEQGKPTKSYNTVFSQSLSMWAGFGFVALAVSVLVLVLVIIIVRRKRMQDSSLGVLKALGQADIQQAHAV
jgi:peptide methionine sulfoxide reductase MsrB